MNAKAPLVTAAKRRALLVARHRLGAAPRVDAGNSSDQISPADEIAAVTEGLVALHSSDPVTVYLSLLNRLPTITVDDIAASLYDRRNLVRVHGMRRTLWVATVPVASDIVAASAARLLGTDRKRLSGFLEEAGITEHGGSWIDDAADEIAAYVVEHGPCDTRTIGEALPHLSASFEVAQGKNYAATISAHSRVLLFLGFQGRVVRADPLGTWIASQYRWSTAQQWLGRPLLETDSSDEAYQGIEQAAQRAMVQRYLHRFGPVTEVDIAWWTGWPLGVIRRALSEVKAVSVQLEDSTDTGWMTPDDMTPDGPAILDSGDVGDDRDRPLSSVSILPGLDPTTMGWKQRDWYLDPTMTSQLFDRNGNGGPTIWVDGQIVGGWAQRDNGQLRYKLLTDVGPQAEEAVETELDRLSQRLGETRFKVRFPSPLNTELRR